MTIVIVGPTASGKTALSIDLAIKYNGEIIATDSRTIYKEMNIGTAKPTVKDMQNIKHYGLDLVYPNDDYNVSMFSAYAKKAMSHIIESNHTPILVGGSGLYIDSLVFNFTFQKPNLVIRDKYKDKTVNELQDIILSQNLELPNNYKNKRHLLLTLEREGQNISKNDKPLKDTIFIGLNPPKDKLIENVTIRAKEMINNGVIKEAVALFNKYGTDCNAFNGGIYKLIPRYLSGEFTKEVLIEEFIKSDMKLAKKQLTWFKRNKLINWFADSNQAATWFENNWINYNV